MYNGAGIYKNGIDEAQVRELMLNTIGGRTYKTTKIGNQIWLAENLDFKFYGLKVGTEEAVEGEPYATYYNNDEATYGVNGNKYGLLYNWYAVDFLNKYKEQLIPGWHVPSRAEWDALATAVGGASVAGTKLKSKTGWDLGNGTDEFGFTALPAGRFFDSVFNYLGRYGLVWSIDEYSPTQAEYIGFQTNALMTPYNNEKSFCCSLRLVRDA